MAFNSNGGSYVRSQIVVEGGKALKPKNPTKAGYVFDEWQLNGVAYDFNTPVTEDITLDAVWEEAPAVEWTVTFESNGGSEVPSQTVADGGHATEPDPAPTKPDYTFVGWFKDQALTTEFVFATEVITADTTIYAKWSQSPAPTYDWIVSFNSNGGSSVLPQTVPDGEHATKPDPDPTKADYDFVMWCKDAELTTEFVFATEVITADTTVYAKWDQSPAPVWEYDVSVSVATEGATGVLHVQPVGGQETTQQMTYGGQAYTFQIPDGDTIAQHYTVLAMYDAEDTSLIEDVTEYSTPITQNTSIPVVFPVITPDWLVTISIATENGTGVLHIQPTGSQETTQTLTYGGAPYTFTVTDGDTIGDSYTILSMYDENDTSVVYDILTQYPSAISADTNISVAVPVVHPQVKYSLYNDNSSTLYYRYSDEHGSYQTGSIDVGETKVIWTADDELDVSDFTTDHFIEVSPIASYQALLVKLELPNDPVTDSITAPMTGSVVTPLKYTFDNHGADKEKVLKWIDFNGQQQTQTLATSGSGYTYDIINSAATDTAVYIGNYVGDNVVHVYQLIPSPWGGGTTEQFLEDVTLPTYLFSNQTKTWYY